MTVNADTSLREYANPASLAADRIAFSVLIPFHRDNPAALVRALADRIVVLHNGELVADGKPDAVMALPQVREIYLGVGADEDEAA